MKKNLALTAALLILALIPYASSTLRKPQTSVLALGQIEACDSAGNVVNTFDINDPVYVRGSGLEPNDVYEIYIVKDYSAWTPDTTHITDLDVVEGPITVDVDDEGNIAPALIWGSATPGHYDIFADSQTEGEIEFYDEYDAIDNVGVNGTGFVVIPEMLLIAIPIVSVLILITYLKRRSKRKQA